MESENGNISHISPQRWTGRILLDAIAEGILNSCAFILRFIVWFLKWTLAGILLLAIMAAAGYYVFMHVVSGGAYVTVPDLTGVSVTDAYALLIKNGLEIGEPREMYNASVPKDFIIAQRPAAGRVVRTGRKVHLTISVGLEKIKAPNLVGMKWEAAKEKIEGDGRFLLGTRASMPDSAPIDTVIGQEPAPGEKMARGTPINLLVSDGKIGERFLMPDLTGKSMEDAQRFAARQGMIVIPVLVDNPDAPFDRVLKQKPQPGTLCRRGQQVEFYVHPSSPIPGAYREVTFTYVVPPVPKPVEIRIDLVNKNGETWRSWYPQPSDFVNGAPPLLSSGQQITRTFRFQDQAKAIIYMNNKPVETRFYEGDAAPVIKYLDVSSVQGVPGNETEALPRKIGTPLERNNRSS